MTRLLSTKMWLALLVVLVAIVSGGSFLAVLSNNLEQLDMTRKIFEARSDRPQTMFSNLPTDNLCPGGESEESKIEAGSFQSIRDSNCLVLLSSRLACLQGQPELAVELLHVAESDCQRRELVAEWAGQLAWSAGDKKQAIDQWSLYDQTTRKMLNWAAEFFHQGELDDSRQLLEAALSLDSVQTPAGELGQAYMYLGLIYRQQSEWPGAVSAFAKAAELTPQRWSAWFSLGGAQRNAGDLDESYESLLQALSLVPVDNIDQVALIHEQLGRTQKELGRYDEAYNSTLLAYCLLSENTGSGSAEMRRLSTLLNQLALESGREQVGDIRLVSCP